MDFVRDPFAHDATHCTTIKLLSRGFKLEPLYKNTCFNYLVNLTEFVMSVKTLKLNMLEPGKRRGKNRVSSGKIRVKTALLEP